MTYKLINDIPVFGEPLDNAVQQLVDVAHMAEYSALMADHHHGYDVPIGSVMAYDGKISPAGVGFDIACGNKAVRLDLQAWKIDGSGSKDMPSEMETIMDAIWKTVSFGPGGINKNEVDDQGLLDDPIWNDPLMNGINKKQAARQLGTIGGGNHYVDVFAEIKQWANKAVAGAKGWEQDETWERPGPVWIGVHFGSRGLGHKLASKFIQAAGDTPNALIDVDSPLGSDYLSAMNFAGKYASVGRSWVCQHVANIIGAEIVEEVHNHHNFAWLENHFDQNLWVVRKGSTPCYPGQKSFVGSTMGDLSVILKGREHPESKVTMYSTVHGAGRIMSRTEAAGKVKYNKKTKERRVVKEGKVSRQDMLDYVWGRGIELRGAGTDEAPQAYKKLKDVLTYHENTVEVTNWLKPIGVAMAGSGRRD